MGEGEGRAGEIEELIHIEVTYQLTQKDFYESFIAHRKTSGWRWFWRALKSLTFAIAALCLLMLLVNRDRQTLHATTPALAVAAFWALLIWATPWLSARSQFSRQPSVRVPRTLAVDTTGLHLRWDGGSTDMEWKHFVRFVESKSQFMLYSSPACFNIVPKRAFTPEQLSDFRELLAKNLPAAK